MEVDPTIREVLEVAPRDPVVYVHLAPDVAAKHAVVDTEWLADVWAAAVTDPETMIPHAHWEPGDSDGMMMWYCPECGALYGREVKSCEVNGAGSPTIPIPRVVAEHIAEAATDASRDDGTLVRVGRVAIGRTDTGTRPKRKRWFVSRYRNGWWLRSAYGDSPWEAVRGAYRG